MATGKATDPVCGVEVDADAINDPVGKVAGGAGQTDPSRGTKWLYNGGWVYFCSVDCRRQFMANPTHYVLKTP